MIKKIKTPDYTITLGSGLLQEIAKYIPKNLLEHDFVIITDTTVKDIHLEAVQDALAQAGIVPNVIITPAGEQYKTQETKSEIDSALIKLEHWRNTCLIALGGGVIGDLTGFVASTYMRGIPYIQVPTTLLSMIDSSVGGKTGINTAEGKNLIGAFWNPSAVIADLCALNTLPKRHLVNGWIEALKIFITCDKSAFKKAAKSDHPSAELIQKAIQLKTKIVSQDPKDTSVRAVLNFGHTFAHALESLSGYHLLHGYAVGYGILLEAQISLDRGLLPQKTFDLIKETIEVQGIRAKTLASYGVAGLLEHCKMDKKNKDNQIHCILLTDLGSVYEAQGQYTHPVTEEEISSSFQALTNGGYYARQ